jgi:para-nitrobenzyl esterase
MSRRLILTQGLLAVLLLGCGEAGPQDPVPSEQQTRELLVQTEHGPVLGFENQGVHSYRAIPYAAPPVGDLRWMPPVAPAAWTEVLEATTRPNGCMQEALWGLPVPGFVASEDCLYLNVDTPQTGSGLPVMVWIHGGGFVLGEGTQTDGGTAGDLIARETDTVVVSMNYRLGPFGFLAHSALSQESPRGASGNYGLMDQTAALQWVQQNIEAFGGDPNNVTIFGESAGAFSVCSHLASPRSAGLFHKAIIQSGSCERPWVELSRAQAQGDAFAAALGCGEAPEESLRCMREASAEDVLAALPPAPNFGFSPSVGPTADWFPILDGDFFEEQPADSFASGDFNQVPTLLGFTRDEARLFVWLGELDPFSPLQVSEDSYEPLVARLLGGNAELAAEAVLEYPISEFDGAAAALAALATDTIFRCPGKLEAAKLRQFVPTYLYQFDYEGGRSQLEFAIDLGFVDAELPSDRLGAFHGADIPYVFGYDPVLELNGMGLQVNSFEPGSDDGAVWRTMLGYWTRFAATGDPNGPGAEAWPEHSAQNEAYLSLDRVVASRSRVAEDRCRFWEGKPYLVPGFGGQDR